MGETQSVGTKCLVWTVLHTSNNPSILTPSLGGSYLPQITRSGRIRTKPLSHHVSMADQLLENVEITFRPRIEKYFVGTLSREESSGLFLNKERRH